MLDDRRMIEIRIREAQKHVDPVDPDPEHIKKELYICGGGAGGRELPAGCAGLALPGD